MFLYTKKTETLKWEGICAKVYTEQSVGLPVLSA